MINGQIFRQLNIDNITCLTKSNRRCISHLLFCLYFSMLVHVALFISVFQLPRKTSAMYHGCVHDVIPDHHFLVTTPALQLRSNHNSGAVNCSLTFMDRITTSLVVHPMPRSTTHQSCSSNELVAYDAVRSCSWRRCWAGGADRWLTARLREPGTCARHTRFGFRLYTNARWWRDDWRGRVLTDL